MKSLLTILSLFVFVTMSFGQDIPDDSVSLEKNNLSTAIVGIAGMACQEGCADKISSNLNEANGVVSSIVSYAKKEAIITFDAGTITPEQLKNIITATKVKEYVYTITTIAIKKD